MIYIITEGERKIKNKFKFVLFIVFFLILFAGIQTPIQVNAHDQLIWDYYGMKSTTDVDKVWNIRFSSNVDPDSVSTSNVYLVREDGVTIPTRIEVNENIIAVSADQSYNIDDMYSLYIGHDIQSVGGVSLQSGMIFDFIVDEPDEEEYDEEGFININNYPFEVVVTPGGTAYIDFNNFINKDDITGSIENVYDYYNGVVAISAGARIYEDTENDQVSMGFEGMPGQDVGIIPSTKILIEINDVTDEDANGVYKITFNDDLAPTVSKYDFDNN